MTGRSRDYRPEVGVRGDGAPADVGASLPGPPPWGWHPSCIRLVCKEGTMLYTILVILVILIILGFVFGRGRF
jgi:hypothetical protein